MGLLGEYIKKSVKFLTQVSDGNTDSLDNVTDHSVIAKLATSDGDASGFDRSTDSLEAISDAINTLTGSAGTINTTTAGTIIQDLASGIPDITGVPSDGSANTFGAWTEVDASAAADVWICSMIVTPNEAYSTAATTRQVCIEIGTGEAYSEVTIARFSIFYRQDYASEVGFAFRGPIPITLSIPIKVASGTRIALRASDDEAAANTYQVGLSYYGGLE